MNTRRVLEVTAVALVSMVFMSPVAEGGWIRRADMPTARSGLSACVVEGKIYAIGGGPSTGVVTRTVEQYDPATDTWTKKANMRQARGFFSVSVVDGKIYALGGYGAGGAFLSSVEQYDPTTDTWTPRASMSTPRKFGSSAVAGGKIYVMGGMDPSETSTLIVEEYDPATDTWTKKANLPMARGAMSCSAVNGIIYVVGGGPSWNAPIRTVDAYDPATDTWTTRSPMPTGRLFLSSCLADGKVFAIGGCRDPYNSSELSSVEMYDPATDVWTIMDDMPTARKALASAAVGGKIYAIGGQPVAGWDATLHTVEQYDLTPPPPDFNGDGRVDGKDVLILAGAWGLDDPLCDIAPAPFGDGLIGLEDLVALADHIGREVDDRTLIAHWPLDEAEGLIAKEHVAGNDAVLVGEPVWQTDAGQVGGALWLDGLDDCAVTEAVLSPAEGPFSILAWIQGGAPGQVILAQDGGANWLMADVISGGLRTELKGAGRNACPLTSETLITDGNWHRVALVCDGDVRSLYVDDVLIAEDTQAGGPVGCEGGLYIGCDKGMTPDTFFSGMIDEIRIYNRALCP